jgi:hypothetical protein
VESRSWKWKASNEFSEDADFTVEQQEQFITQTVGTVGTHGDVADDTQHDDGGLHSPHQGSTSIVGSNGGEGADGIVNEIGSDNAGTEHHSVTVPKPATEIVESGTANGAQSAGGSGWDQQSDEPGFDSDGDEEPLKFRSLNEVYEETSEVELSSDSELGALLALVEEPSTYKEAAENVEWVAAMDSEIQSICKNGTWELAELPSGHKPIGLKWVYKLKRNSEGEIVKHKARLVAKGYVQKQGVDFEEVFAPVARLDTIRLILALAANRGWQIHHLDVKSAFLNGELEEEVYVCQPEGYVQKGKEKMVLKLSKALYGLRQAPRAWNIRLDRSLRKLGFSECPSEAAVYKRGSGKDAVVLGVYVDDLIVKGENPVEIEKFKKQMTCEFDMSD